MPGLAEPVYEVKRTRLSPPSSGAYEAQAVTEVPPVTGTHWTNDGFERRGRPCCEAGGPSNLSQMCRLLVVE